MKIVIVSNKEWHRHIAVAVAAETGASVMYLTQRDTAAFREELNALHARASSVAHLLGVEDAVLCKFPDNRMDSVDRLEVVKRVE